MEKIEVLKAYSVKRKLPINLHSSDQELFEVELSRKFSDVYYTLKQDVYLLPEGYMVSNRNLIRTPHRKLNLFSQILIPKFRFFLFSLLGHSRIKKAAIVHDEWSHGYHHWFSDALPKIYLLNKSMPDIQFIIPADYKKIPFIRESLINLEVDFSYGASNRLTKVDQAFVMSSVAPSGNYNPSIMQEIRDFLFQNKKRPAPHKLIYISRENAPRRKIINETELRDLLIKYGFEILSFEKISWKDQIEICHETKFLISLHGAGLTNMLFMQEKTSVLEFRKISDSRNNCYFSLASAMNIDYYYQLCNTDNEITQRANFIVDLELLETNIKCALDSMNE